MSAPDLAAFAGAAHATAADPGSPKPSFGTATQNSTVAPGTLHDAGALEVYGQGDAGVGLARSAYSVRFTLADPGQFTLSATVQMIEGYTVTDVAGDLRLLQLDNAGQTYIDTLVDLAPDPQSVGLWQAIGGGAKPLAAGTYRLDFDVQVQSNDNVLATYSLDVGLTSGAAVSVPMPVMAWPMLVMLGLGALGIAWSWRRVAKGLV